MIRNNGIRDVTANLLTEVCHDEPDLQPLTGEALTHSTSNTADGARLDIADSGEASMSEPSSISEYSTLMHPPIYRNTSISNCYKKHEPEK
jgi:hypothetical protein